MAALWLLIAMAAGLCVLGAVLGIVAFIQSREMARRIDRLEAELRNERARNVAAPAVDPLARSERASAPPPMPTWDAAPAAPVFATKPAPPVARTIDPVVAIPAARAPGPSTSQPEPRATPSVAPPEPRSVPVAPDSPAPSGSKLELERWLGVRGAAVLGGVVVAIAGYLFLQYSIQRQLISPEMRVVIGAIVGVACFASAIPLRKRGYELVANSITGAGVVLLYAASFAAYRSFGMVDFWVAFAAMVAVTAACAWLAKRHGSLVIAVLGLVGGFATPIALSSGKDDPIALFGYVLLLDLAFLFVAAKRRWPSLGLIALVGTFVMQGLWILERMDHTSLVIGLVVLAGFALVFALFARRLATAERVRWVVFQGGALLLPFLFALYFAVDHDLGPDLWPLAALAAVLAIAAGWMGRARELAWLPFGSASGSVALAFTWTLSREADLSRAQSSELVVCSLALACVHWLFAELASWKRTSDEVLRGSRGAALVAAFGFQGIVLFAASRSMVDTPWIWIATSVVLALAVVRAVALGAGAPSALVACGLTGATVLVWSLVKRAHDVAPATDVWCGSIVLGGGALLLAAWLVRARSSQLPFFGIAAFVVPALCAQLVFEQSLRASPVLALGATLLLGVQLAFASTAARSSVLFVVAIVATWITLVIGDNIGAIARSDRFAVVFTVFVAAAAVFTLWPVARPNYWIERSNAWRAAALVPVLWFFPIHALVVARWPGAPIFTLPIGFELLAGLAALRLVAAREHEDRSRRVGRLWFSCTAIFFAALIVPLQVGHEPLGITLALFALGIALFERRADARALAWVAMGAMVVSVLALVVFRPFESFPHSAVRVWNSLAYVYLLPGAAAAVSASFLRRRVGVVPATVTGLCAVLFVFAWINLEIANAFTSGERFTPRLEHVPARDLTVSIAWAAYAIVLLLLGASKQRGGLRWASLVLLLLTIGKVFLFDLGQLGGLYRAASVFGLGVSLLLVSILYQRFVFRRQRPAA